MNSLSVTPNVQLNVFKSQKNASQSASPSYPEGDEPAVITGRNDVIFVVWIGLSASRPTTYLNSSTQFRTQIFFAESTNKGTSFSSPIQVSNGTDPLSYYCFDPSVAVTQNGSIFVSYVADSYGGVTNSLILAVRDNLSNSKNAQFTLKTVASSAFFDRPWVAISNSNSVYLVWDNGANIFWISSPVEKLNFSAMIPIPFDFIPAAAFSTGIALSNNGTLYISILTHTYAESANQYDIIIAELKRSSTFRVFDLGTISSPYPPFPAYNFHLFHPWPTITVSRNGIVFAAYISGNGRTISLVRSDEENSNFSAPEVLLHLNSSLIQMPIISVNPDGTILALSWIDNSTGYWNTYSSVYSQKDSIFLQPIKVSSENGYASDVLNWHGDFLGLAFLSNSSFITVWGDGRGLPNYYGYGNIYSAIVSKE